MNLKAFTILSLIFIGITMFSINPAYSEERYINNESFDNIHLEMTSWCKDMMIYYQIYNKSDYDNMDYINEREYYSIRNMSDAIVKIYDGPFDINDLLLDIKTNKTGGFRYEFNKTGLFLLEIYVKKQEHFNTFTKVLEIVNCDIKEELMKQNLTFEYPKFKAKIIANKTNMNDSDNATIININKNRDNRVKNINKTIKPIEIKLSQRSFYKKLYLELEVDLTENESIETFGYDTSKDNNWTKINSFLNENKTILTIDITKNKFIYYEKKIIIDEIKPEESKINETIKDNNSNQNNINNVENMNNGNNNADNSTLNSTQNKINSTEPIITGNSKEDKKTLLTPFNIVIVAIPIIIILIVVITKISINRNRITASKPFKDSNNITHLSSYKQIYENAKKYVDANKNYGKDAVSKGLKSANVPNDLIDKIIKEEFKSN